MSDEPMRQAEPNIPAVPPMTDEHRWGEPITAERQQELEQRLQVWEAEGEAGHGERQSAFDGVHLSGADVFYLAARTLAGPGGNVADAVAQLQFFVDLSALHLEDANLRAAHLERANLSAAHLERANLSAAHLEGKSMAPADLERVRRWDENFPSPLLPADLRQAFFDPATTFDGLTLGDAQYGYFSVAGVRWGASTSRW